LYSAFWSDDQVTAKNICPYLAGVLSVYSQPSSTLQSVGFLRFNGLVMSEILKYAYFHI